MKRLTKILLLVVVMVLSLVIATSCETLQNHTHKAATEWSSDGTNHYHTCTFEGCTEKLDLTPCSGGTATFESKAVCSTCNNQYGDVLPETLENHIHKPATEWTSDGTNHYHACTFSGCQEKLDLANCSGGTATLESKAVCSTCNNQYGEVLPETLENHIHKPATDWSSDGTNHYHACTFSGCQEKLDIANCSGGTATIQEKATCATCGNKYGELLPETLENHIHKPATDWTSTGKQHYHGCTFSGCQVKFDEEFCSGEKVEDKLICSTCKNQYTEPTLADKYPHITIAEAQSLAQAAGENGTTEQYTIVGTIVTVSNAMYGEMTIADETGELYIYGSMSADGTYYDSMTEKPVKGDIVVLKGVLKTYSGTPQMATKNQKAIIVDWQHVEVEIDLTQYTTYTIAQVRDLEKGEKVIIRGVVAAITYANGQIPSGVILVDNTSSIYVYSGDIAQQVSVGNEIEVAATRTYWILADEQKHATAHGYKGACQVDEAILISNDKGANGFDTSWIKELTVKQLLNTSVTENITSLVVKSTAYIKKAQGSGFVNYYINDLDGKTGSYVYTQCNGKDFAWMEKFDGKICEVYYTALNAKSSAAGCVFRLLPIAIAEVENFTFPTEDIPSFAIEYAVADLFVKTVYGADPAIELPNNYSNDIIGTNNVTFTYESDNSDVATITVGQESTILNLVGEGTCTITIKATHNGLTVEKTVSLTLNPLADIQTPTVAEIIATQDGTKVQLRGIVISSVVNQTAFYIGDSTGIIAVRTTEEMIAQIKPGDEIVVEGIKKHVKKDPSSTSYVGQCAIDDATLVANYYGENDYDTSYFITGKTIADLHDLDPKVDYSTNVYVVQAKVVVEETSFYTKISLLDPTTGTNLSLYCSSANQYSWLKQYDGQVITAEIAPCNWNGKNYYAGCVISATVNGVKTINMLNFSSK